MFFRLVVAALAALSSPIHSYAVHRRAPKLDVQLKAVGNSEIEAVVTNNAAHEVALLNRNTILDSGPVKKVSVVGGDSQLEFEGIIPRYLISALGEESFTVVPAGESVSNTFDLAEIHDLSEGGGYVVSSRGAIPFADPNEPNGNTIEGVLSYESNELELDVDGDAASAVPKAISVLDKRTNIANDCSGSDLSSLQTALGNSAQLASQAASAVSSDTSLLQEYYSTTDAGTQQTVMARLQAVSQESSSSSSGATTYHCNDPLNACGDNVLAYTLPSQNLISNCPLYYSALPPLSSQCNGQDQASTTLHEFTHAPGVYSPGTNDFAYGYEASTSLSTDQAVNNADNYALLAINVYLGCS